APSVKELGMAEEQVGVRKDYLRDLAPWTRLFSAFKIALDPKKLLLAGAGIFAMSLCWYILALIFFAARAERPQWNKPPYTPADYENKPEAAWAAFKAARYQWNLLYEMAGTPPVVYDANGRPEPITQTAYKRDAADVANTLAEYIEITRVMDEMRSQLTRLEAVVSWKESGSNIRLVLDNNLDIDVKPRNDADREALKKTLQDKKVHVRDIKV